MTGRSRCSRKARPAIRTRATSGRRRRSWASAPRLPPVADRSSRRSATPQVQANASAQGFNAQQASSERQAIPAASLDAYKKTIARTGEYVHMLGTMIGSSAVRVMRESIQPIDTARIWSGQESFSCPGRVRNDADNPARENVFPGYKDGPD